MPWWVAAATVISSFLGGRSAKKRAAREAQARKEAIVIGAQEDRKTADFERQLQEYYQQVDRQKTRGGLAEYAKLQTVGGPQGFAPGYQQTFVPPTPGSMPTAQVANAPQLMPGTIVNQNQLRNP